MATPNVKTHSGNRIVVELDGKQVGLLQSVGGDDDYALEPASGIGDIHVQEYVPTMASHTISVSSMTLMVGNLRDAGIAVENGDAALQGRVFDLVYYSKDTNQPLRKYMRVSYNSGRVEVQKHHIVITSAQLKALDVNGLGF